MALTRDDLRALPKVSLHDHLDGALRPATLLDLADEIGRPVPAETPESLADWFFAAANSGSLPRYLETFAHTVAVLQRPEALARVAREYVLDLAADGVVYGEARWAPELHVAGGMAMAEAVEAVTDGLAAGMRAAAEAGTPVVARQILCGMRHTPPTTAVAELVLRYADAGVAGFDIAGPEDGYPAVAHAAAFDLVRAGGGHCTAHAGEAAGPESIRQALMVCGAERLGHGVRIVADIADLSWSDGSRRRTASGLGELAAYVRDQRIPLEVCPTSNVQTGVCGSIAEHPIGQLAALDFVVTVNCDNRLQSRTTATDELAAVCAAFGFGLADVERFTVDAAAAAFWDPAAKARLIQDVIRPAYAAARTSSAA
ncbi:MAG: adenosine deaminase [Austwickia sp.]|nr:adenosine deaminase [Austwickia sp.]MCO5308390.1 adenosine deaminase [Austwickia sp.]